MKNQSLVEIVFQQTFLYSLSNPNTRDFFLPDKFDQFWSVNRKLMEHTGEDGFRHIPFRLYVPNITSKPYLQFLIKPVENEKQTTLQDLVLKANLKIESKGMWFFTFTFLNYYHFYITCTLFFFLYYQS